MDMNKMGNAGFFGAEQKMFFTVRDSFGDNVGEAQYASFDAAADTFKQYCEKLGHEADDAWLGVVYHGEERSYKCALVQHEMTSMGNRYRSMENNISERALAVPEIKLAALKASQLQYPFDERTQQRIDELEKQLGVFDRDVRMDGDLYVGKWRVHIVPPGGRYGLNNRLINKDPESMIEFWDMSANKGSFPAGQFVTRYDVDSLYDTKWGHGAQAMMRGGLCLDGGNAASWSLSGDEMKQVFGWLQTRELMPGENYLQVIGEVDVPFGMMDNVPLPHMDSATMSGEVILHQQLFGHPCIRDLHVEQMGVYDNGVGYTFSFNSQAKQREIEKALDTALYGLRNEFSCEEKTVAVVKEPLDKVIKSCEDVSKTEAAAGDQERAGRSDADERQTDRDF